MFWTCHELAKKNHQAPKFQEQKSFFKLPKKCPFSLQQCIVCGVISHLRADHREINLIWRLFTVTHENVWNVLIIHNHHSNETFSCPFPFYIPDGVQRCCKFSSRFDHNYSALSCTKSQNLVVLDVVLALMLHAPGELPSLAPCWIPYFNHIQYQKQVRFTRQAYKQSHPFMKSRDEF